MKLHWTSTLFLSVLCWTSVSFAQASSLTSWMDRPGVRLVLVNFYASWCEACEDNYTDLEALRTNYHQQGLRVVTVHTNDPGVKCGDGAPRTDDLICDTEGELADALRVHSLPSMLLWSWDGRELGQSSTVKDIEGKIKRQLLEIPRVAVHTRDENGQSDKALRDLVRDELTLHGKYTLVADTEERTLAARVRKESFMASQSTTQRCKLGEEQSANTVAEVKVQGDYLRMQLMSAETACISQSVVVRDQVENRSAAVTELVDKLMSHIVQSADGQNMRVVRELTAWQLAKQEDKVNGFLAYLKSYPEGRFTQEARQSVRRLRHATPMKQVEPKVAERKPERRERDVRKINSHALSESSYVRIQAGEFLMGSPSKETGRNQDEGPQRRVVISHDFLMQKHEVTQHQWYDITGDRTLVRDCRWNCPVVGVTLYDAVVYLNRLSKRAKLETCYEIDGDDIHFRGIECRGFRLPTEAEWEYAARAGSGDSRYGALDAIAWSKQDGKRRQGVMKKQPNAFGLYDMLGNVWEWTNDVYGAYSTRSEMNPSGKLEGPYVSIRGGSWFTSREYLRAAYRGYKLPDYAGTDLGFRAVRTLAANGTLSQVQ